MNITLSFDSELADREFIPVEVSGDMSMDDFMAYIEAESTIPQSSQILIFKGEAIPTGTDAQKQATLIQVGFTNGDMVLVRDIRKVAEAGSAQRKPFGAQSGTASGGVGGNHVAANESSSSSSAAASSSAGGPQQLQSGSDYERLYAEFERIRNHILSNPVIRSGVYQQYPHLESVVNDPVAFRNAMLQIEQERVESEKKKQEAMKKLHDDPFDPESQEIILRAIREEAIMENFNAAMENNPEAFASVTMLFIDTVVNRHHVKAFVDSGAQATIMSPDCAEACGIAHLIDKRFQGMAMGVGTAKILGRIHSVPVNIGGQFLDTSFTVMEGKGVDFLLGLDMLKKHRAVIDLRENKLQIADIEVSFLPEAEIPNTGLFSQAHKNAQSDGVSDPIGSGVPAPSLKNNVQGESNSSLGASNASRGAHAGPGPSSQSRPQVPTASSSSSSAATASRQPAAPQSTIPKPSSASSSAQHLFPAAQPSPRQTSYPENDISSLMGLGFTREQVIEALNLSGGNVEHAAAILFP